MKKTTVLGAIAASLMMFGAAAQAQALPPRGDLDRDGIQNRHDRDRDGDGIENRSDPQPNVFNRTRIVRGHDLDRDGIADRSDRDMDGDGVANRRDAFPRNPNRA
ncbi:MAG TPA: thrombospondin type 3 repeat-containing protein [Ramlibacter sp.]|jgi:hypothetical protein|nr:thrombospondin type 3 repeat-containing protein [Ramlibacter sp.]